MALYAWSQAGGRQEIVAAIEAHTADDDARLVEFLVQLSGAARGRGGNLSTDGLRCFFDDVPALLEHLMALAAKRVDGAPRVLQLVSSSLRFHNDSLKGWIAHQREGADTRADAGLPDGDAVLAGAPASTDTTG